ncbi:cytochrome c [Thiomicrorhabdus arctica]|jgi:cytochrome c peroxidase|uniref:cytochrome c n=1 Tax=Thiomicrorhabdus arctica TaxID=131540 RepID=UPI000365528A|nr:cytochrome c [Thiomicrorhabdus arctica]
MKKLTFSLTGALLMTSQVALAEEHPGAELHKSANCMSCHTAKPYNPKVTDTYPKLVKKVQFCSDNLNTGMFEDEVEQLADYLNDTYYHHPK